MVCVCLKSQKELENVSCPLSFIKNICCSFVKASCSLSLTEALSRLTEDLQKSCMGQNHALLQKFKLRKKYTTF